MLLDPRSIDALKTIIMGDHTSTPYLKGCKLVEWFNQHGLEDEYPRSVHELGSRSKYTIDRVTKINEDANKIKGFIESIVDSRRFVGTDLKIIEAVKVINDIIINDDLVIKESQGVYSLSALGYPSREINIKPIFENIQSEILDQIESAEFLIWVAVAWFTDATLFDALEKKRKSGLSVKVILIDDETNKNSKLSFKNSCVKWSPRYGDYQNIMHHKFCIIDLKIVIHGSYNWTNKAQFNQEDITITKDRKTAEDWAKKFVQLWCP